MKHLFSRWLISKSLDDRKPLSNSRQQSIRFTPELQQYRESLLNLDAQLKTESQQARSPLPDTLQLRTIRALQEFQSAPTRPSLFRSPMMMASLGLCALLFLSLVLVQNFPLTPSAKQDSSPLAQRSPLPANPLVESATETVSRPMGTLVGLTWFSSHDFERAVTPDPLITEARSIMMDAERAADAILASFPKMLMTRTKPDANGVETDA